MATKPVRVMAVASGGGHWEQLVMLLPAFASAEIKLCCTSQDLASRSNVGAVTILPDCNRDRIKATLVCALAVWRAVRMTRPDLIVSTGAAPGAIALAIGKLHGAKVVWVDSVANAEKLSMSGRLCSLFADLCLTQWPHLASERGPHYAGAVL